MFGRHEHKVDLVVRTSKRPEMDYVLRHDHVLFTMEAGDRIISFTVEDLLAEYAHKQPHNQMDLT